MTIDSYPLSDIEQDSHLGREEDTLESSSDLQWPEIDDELPPEVEHILKDIPVATTEEQINMYGEILSEVRHMNQAA